MFLIPTIPHGYPFSFFVASYFASFSFLVLYSLFFFAHDTCYLALFLIPSFYYFAFLATDCCYLSSHRTTAIAVSFYTNGSLPPPAPSVALYNQTILQCPKPLTS